MAADGSDDRTVEIASGYSDRGVLVLHRPERAGKLAAITRAVAAATGDVVVFSDANNRYDEAALREMAAPFADPRVGAVSGRKAVIDEDALGYSEGLYWKYESAIKRWETRFGSTVGVNGEIIAVRRELFATAPDGVINDDTWLARLVLRGGHRIAYAEKALSVERVSADAAAEQERRSRMVAGQIQVLLQARTELPWKRPVITWQLISHKLLRPLVPVWMAVCLIASLLALAFPGSGTGLGAVATLATPWNIVVVAAQAALLRPGVRRRQGNRRAGQGGLRAPLPLGLERRCGTRSGPHALGSPDGSVGSGRPPRRHDRADHMTTLDQAPVLDFVTDDAALMALGAEWDELLADADGASIFLTHAWISSWRATVGADVRLLIGAAREPASGRLVGIAPFVVGSRRFGPISVDVLRMAGSGIARSDHLDLIVRHGHPHVAAALWHATALRRTWDLIDLDGLRPGSHLARTLLRRRGDRESFVTETVCPVLPLPETWEEYEESLGQQPPSEPPPLLPQARQGHVRVLSSSDS